MYTLSNPQLDMRKIALSGQIFRFNEISEGSFRLIANDRLLNIYTIGEKSLGNEKYFVYELDCDEKEYQSFWKNYFDMDTNYEYFARSIPREDEFLTKGAKFSRGIRILRQDKWEMLISFIISQRKNIPAIKSSIEKLSKQFGEKKETLSGIEYYAFPTAKQIANADIDKLNACSLGYRAGYILDTARKVYEGMDLDSFDNLADDKLIEKLKEFNGVGVKVANCTALFGYHRIATFPIDVWIQRVIDERYNGNFPINKYSGFAGVIQQYMFFYGRELGNKRG